MPPLPGPDPGPLALSFWWEVAIFSVFLLVFVSMIFWARRTQGKVGTERWILLAVMFGGLLLSFNEARLPALWRALVASIGLAATQCLTGLSVVALGWLAYRFKRYSKLYYGYSEVFLGVLSALMVVRHVNFAGLTGLTLTQVVSLVAAAYAVSRGLANCQEAKSTAKGQATRAAVANA